MIELSLSYCNLIVRYDYGAMVVFIGQGMSRWCRGDSFLELYMVKLRPLENQFPKISKTYKTGLVVLFVNCYNEYAPHSSVLYLYLLVVD